MEQLEPLDVLYCALCDAEMPFENIEVGPCEFVCVTCGSAIFLDPPCQDAPSKRTA